MKDADEIDEFEAAALVRMSPQLLKAFTSRSPKKGDERKLPYKKVGTHRTYSRKELQSFDEYLRKPWPTEEGKRPHIPTKIQKEVRDESFLQCAVCHSHADTCELAHIEPVASSKCNHPHNLILLCANHHTKFDKQGVLGPREEVRDVVQSFKNVALHATRVKWASHASSIAECFSIAQLCAHLEKELEAIQEKAAAEQVKFFELLAEQAVSRLRETAYKGKVLSRKQASTGTSEQLWEKLEKSTHEPTPRARLASAAELSLDDDLRAAAGFVDCPLCEGAGFHNELVCSVCSGERQVEAKWAERIDLAPYKLVKCPLCKGNGRQDGEDCPVCHGDRKIERRFADQVDVAEFEEVNCPLCEGEGRMDGEDCPECHGNRTLPRHYADRVDVQAYQKVNCPVCEGDGRDVNGDQCRACGGEGEMTRGQRDQTDLSDYKSIECQLCEGSGRLREGDCPPCNGEGALPRYAADHTDWSRWDLVKCPMCRGRRTADGDDCPTCAGEGKVFRMYADE